MKQKMKEIALMTLGVALVSVGVYFFKFPNSFTTGGVTGISILLGSVVEAVSPGTFVTVINLLFLLLGFVVVNRGFGLRTVYCSLLFSLMVQGLEWLVPMTQPLTNQKLLELFFSVLLPALGSAILFNMGASTGGTDIAAIIMKKYVALDTGMALLFCDLLIAASALFVFGIETGLYSVLGLVLKSVVVDSVIDSLNRRKSVMIVTAKPEVVCDYIINNLHRGATRWQAEGAYTGQHNHVVLAALSAAQAANVRRHLKTADPDAFLLIMNSSEIFGKGFLRA